jgi:membrane associated rhomboid family serine protease
MSRSIWLKIKLVAGVILFISALHVVNMVLGGRLSQFGVIPRDMGSLFHIATAPFIHGSLGHLINNVIGLSIFSAFCLLRSIRVYVWSSVFIIVVGGLMVWLFGRNASHIGASGWIFGLWSLSIANAIFDRSFQNILVAVLVVFLYGGMIYGVLPSSQGISFEGHFFGAVAGIACAFLLKGLAKK